MELAIEWRHYEKEGTTCERCSATGSSVKDVISELGNELSGRGINISFTETPLPEDRMAQSNIILINGVPLETILDNAAADETHCQSCSCMTGSETSCRTIEYEGNTYEEIPGELIRKAIYKVIGLKQE